MILFWVLMINDILLGSDDSDNELDEIEPDFYMIVMMIQNMLLTLLNLKI